MIELETAQPKGAAIKLSTPSTLQLIRVKNPRDIARKHDIT
jgi:hypothetical protein